MMTLSDVAWPHGSDRVRAFGVGPDGRLCVFECRLNYNDTEPHCEPLRFQGIQRQHFRKFHEVGGQIDDLIGMFVRRMQTEADRGIATIVSIDETSASLRCISAAEGRSEEDGYFVDVPRDFLSEMYGVDKIEPGVETPVWMWREGSSISIVSENVVGWVLSGTTDKDEQSDLDKD